MCSALRPSPDGCLPAKQDASAQQGKATRYKVRRQNEPAPSADRTVSTSTSFPASTAALVLPPGTLMTGMSAASTASPERRLCKQSEQSSKHIQRHAFRHHVAPIVWQCRQSRSWYPCQRNEAPNTVLRQVVHRYVGRGPPHASGVQGERRPWAKCSGSFASAAADSIRSS